MVRVSPWGEPRPNAAPIWALAEASDGAARAAPERAGTNSAENGVAGTQRHSQQRRTRLVADPRPRRSQGPHAPRIGRSPRSAWPGAGSTWNSGRQPAPSPGTAPGRSTWNTRSHCQWPARHEFHVGRRLPPGRHGFHVERPGNSRPPGVVRHAGMPRGPAAVLAAVAARSVGSRAVAADGTPAQHRVRGHAEPDRGTGLPRSWTTSPHGSGHGSFSRGFHVERPSRAPEHPPWPPSAGRG